MIIRRLVSGKVNTRLRVAHQRRSPVEKDSAVECVIQFGMTQASIGVAGVVNLGGPLLLGDRITNATLRRNMSLTAS